MIKLNDFLLNNDKTPFYQSKKRSEKITINGEFIQGPLSLKWLNTATSLGLSAIKLGLHLLHMWSLKNKDTTFKLTSRVEKIGMGRTTRYRTLKAMEDAHLIKIEQLPGQYPVITLINMT